MKKNSNLHVILGCFTTLLITNTTLAQEWSIEGGAHFINQRKENAFPISGKSEGFSVGIGYSKYLNTNWSLNTGISYFNSKINFAASNINGTYNETDMENDSFEFRYNVESFEEKIQCSSFRIPLTLQYETLGIVRWYMRTGVVYDISIGNSKYNQNWGNIKTSGYYPQWDAELHGPNYVGFGNMGNLHHEGNFKLQNNFSWLVETGVKQQLRAVDDIYLGLFFELGLNNIRPKTDATEKAIVYTKNIQEPLVYNSVLNQEIYKDKKLALYTIGFKIRYAIDF